MKKLFNILLVLVFCFALIGCNKTDPTENPTDNTVEKDVLKFNGDVKYLAIFDSVISRVQFRNNAKIAMNDNITANIDDNGTIRIDFLLKNNDSVTHEVILDSKPISLDVSYDNKTEKGYVYALTEDGKIYRIEMVEKKDVTKIRYDIPNVDSFVVMNADIEGNNQYKSTIIIKSSDNKYYTDYKFVGDTDTVIRQLTGDEI